MKKAIEILQKIQIIAGGVFLGIFLAAVLVQIFSRYLGISVTWTEDITAYTFIWAVFMGASAMVLERRHFAFTTLSEKLSSPLKKLALSLMISLVILAFSLCMVYYGIRIARQFWNYHWIYLVALKRGPVWLCIPIAGAASALYSVYHIVNDIGIYKEGKRKNT
jgi:TRAP-type C4-dicarboxylate transport system permease small subunit